VEQPQQAQLHQRMHPGVCLCMLLGFTCVFAALQVSEERSSTAYMHSTILLLSIPKQDRKNL
jgi:hypothetical protein